MVRALLTAGLVATALIATPQQSVGPDIFKSATGALIIILALAIWLWPGLSRRDIVWHPFLCAPISLSLYAILSTLWSPAGTALVEAGRWALITAILLLALNTTRRNYFESIAQAMHWACVALSVLALAQFWLGLEWFPARAAPGSTFGNRNFFAELLAATFPLSLWLSFRRQTIISNLRTTLGFSIIIVALMSTGTRAALIAAIFATIAMTVLLAFTKHKSLMLSKPLVLLATIIFISLTVLGLGSIPSTNDDILRDDIEMKSGRTAIERTAKRLGSLVQADTYEEDSSFGIRRAGWSAAWQMIQKHPIQGIGAGGWNNVSPLYMPEQLDTQAIWMAHNEPLQLVVEYGVVGWMALLSSGVLLTFASARNLSRLRSESRVKAFQALRPMVIVISLIVMGVTSLSGLPLHAAATCYLLAIYLGLLLTSSCKTRKFTLPQMGSLGALVPRLAVLCLLTAGIAISIQAIRFDYYVRQGVGALQGLAESPQLRSNPKFAELRDHAFSDIDKGLGIYPEHTLLLMPAIGSMVKLNEYDQALVYLQKILAHIPHLTDAQCQEVQMQANLKRFDAAEAILSRIERARPQAVCLPITKFVLAYKREDFLEATNLGKAQIEKVKIGNRPDEARYLVDYTYRAAIRISDWDTALKALAVRATLWPELKAGSWLLAARLQAGLAQSRISPEAIDSYKKALSASTTSERQQIIRDLPPTYRDVLQPNQTK